MMIVQAVDKVNKRQKANFVSKIVNRFGEDLKGLTFAVWGLAFKPKTNDMREAPAIYVIEELLKRGALIRGFDPKAMQCCFLQSGMNLGGRITIKWQSC